MYIKAGKKLSRAQDSHFYNKAVIAALQSVPQFSSIVSLMYYYEALNAMSSAYTIQRQDAWNTWLLYEIIETDIFGNDVDTVPTEFARMMSKAQVAAMSTYYQEASVDLQMMFIRYYLQSAGMQLLGHNNAAAANSFLEEESTAEPAQPNKPFFPMMMMGGGANPQMYLMMMKYWSVMFNFQAAQGLYQFALIEEQSWTADHVDTHLSAQVKTHAVSALQQWAYLNMMQLMFTFQGFAMGGVSHNAAAAANANAFVQTEAAAPASAPETQTPEVTAEQKAVLESAMAQFLRPQPLPQAGAAQ